MKTAILLTTLLILGAVAVAPTASAGHIACGIEVELWQLTCRTADAGIHYAECYPNTAPVDWVGECL